MLVTILRTLSAIRLAFDLEDDGSLHQSIEECHSERAVRQIISPFIKVHVGHQSSRALLVSGSDDLVKQVSGLRALGALDAVESELVNKCSAEHLSINVKLSEMWS